MSWKFWKRTKSYQENKIMDMIARRHILYQSKLYPGFNTEDENEIQEEVRKLLSDGISLFSIDKIIEDLIIKQTRRNIMGKRIKPQESGIELKKISPTEYQLSHKGTILTDLCGDEFEDLFGPLFTIKNVGDRILVGISHNEQSINLLPERIESYDYPVFLQSITRDIGSKRKIRGGVFLFGDSEHGICVHPHENGKYRLNESDVFSNVEENKDRWELIDKKDLFKNA